MRNPFTLAIATIAISYGSVAVAQRPGSGRAVTRDDSTANGPFVSSTLPTTGHPTRFKHYAESAGSQFGNYAGSGGGNSGGSFGGMSGSHGGSTGSINGVLNPYLNFARGGSLLNNYLSYQRDTQIYATGAQTQQISSQLQQMSESRPTRPTTRPFVQNIDTTPTPLERRFQSQDRDASGPNA